MQKYSTHSLPKYQISKNKSKKFRIRHYIVLLLFTQAASIYRASITRRKKHMSKLPHPLSYRDATNTGHIDIDITEERLIEAWQ